MCVCVSRVYHPASGRVLEVWTSQPGVQFYTANYLDGSLLGKGGSAYGKHSSFCLETQNWPDAVNQVCRSGKMERLISQGQRARWRWMLLLLLCSWLAQAGNASITGSACVQATFPNCLLRAGERYHHVTRFSFTTA